LSPSIGLLNEKSLHAALKAWYAEPDDILEAPIDGYVVDIVRGDLLVEIQTRNFAAIRAKLAALSARHPLRLVYPLAVEKWIVRLSPDGMQHLSHRKSPKKGAPVEVFSELVSIPHLLTSPNFSLELLLIREEEMRRYDGTRAWRRRGWVTQERRLLDVIGRQVFATPGELGALLPADLDEPFTTLELAVALGASRRLAQRMAYCLRAMGVLSAAGKRGRSVLHIRNR